MDKNKPPRGLRYALSALVRWLESTGTQGAVIGGVAASVQGRSRFTRDVDAVVSLDESRLLEFLASGAQHGFRPRRPDCVEFARRHRVLLVEHVRTEIGIDLSIAGIAFEHDLIERAQRAKYVGVLIPVARPEDLIVMKAVAGRPQDSADIDAILAAHPRLNRKRVLQIVGELAEALDRPEILDDLKRLLSRRMKR